MLCRGDPSPDSSRHGSFQPGAQWLEDIISDNLYKANCKGFNTFYVARIQLAFQNVFGDAMTACLFRAESRKKFEPF